MQLYLYTLACTMSLCTEEKRKLYSPILTGIGNYEPLGSADTSRISTQCDLDFVPDTGFKFYRLKLKDMVLNSIDYKRCKKSNNHTVAYCGSADRESFGSIQHFLELYDSVSGRTAVVVCLQAFVCQNVQFQSVKMPHLFQIQSTYSCFIPALSIRHKVIHVVVNTDEFVARPFDLAMENSL